MPGRDTGKLADPEYRHQRAVKAARSRTTPDAHIDALVRSAPPLSPEQAQKLRSLLPSDESAGESDD